MKHSLLLGSQSQSRQRLLKEARIPFEVVGHNADETACITGLTLPQEIVQKIALEKMEHVNLPLTAEPGQTIFVLTADTLCVTQDGKIQGKPVDRFDAIEKIKAARGGARVGTAFCLDKRAYKNNQWQVIKRIETFVHADYVFDVPDEWIDRYLEHSLGLSGSGAIAIEEFGDQFLQKLNGSYSAIVGLPMFELRNALVEIGFF